MKRNLKIALAAVGMIAAGLIFWHIVAAFMWLCYYAGIPM